MKGDKKLSESQLKYLGPSKKSSFHRLWKYASNRRALFSTPLDWLKAKKRDDDIAGNLWRVHDKLYDLSPFVEKHPGGSEWLEMSQGMDITELFENSHLVNVSHVEATLQKFYVQEATQPRNSPYTFHPTGFYRTLKRKLQPILKENGTSPTLGIKCLQDSLILGALLFSMLGVYLHSYLYIVIAGVFLGAGSAAAHNFFHIKDNWRKYYFDLSLCSHYEWRISHVFSHHGFPNTVLDAEVSMFQPAFEFLPTRRKNAFQRFGPYLYSHLVYFIAFPMAFTCRVYSIYKGRQKPRKENFLILIQLFLFILFSPSLRVALNSWVILHAVCSYWVVLTGLNAAHHHPICWHDGDETSKNPDFGLCQLDATCVKVEDGDRNLLQIMTTFGEHNLHHLFPALCISKIHLVKPVVEETVKEFQEELFYLTQWQLYTGLHEQFARVQPRSIQQNLEDRRR